MDIEKLIERLRHDANAYRNGDTLGRAYADQEDVLDRAVDTLSALQAENEKLRAERVELEQMAACVYYKQGGLCRYGEEDPANVCVFGPCPHQRSAQEVLAQLEQVKRERDEAVHDRMMMEQRIGELNARAEAAEADNKKLCAAMMQLKRTDRPERMRVIYALEYDSSMSHKTMEEVAGIFFRGLMDADVSGGEKNGGVH